MATSQRRRFLYNFLAFRVKCLSKSLLFRVIIFILNIADSLLVTGFPVWQWMEFIYYVGCHVIKWGPFVFPRIHNL